MLECVDRQGMSLEIGDDNAVAVANGDAVICTFTNTAQVDPGCTYTQGYWKTHADSSKKQYDPTWNLIQPSGPSSPFFLSGQTYVQVMNANSRLGVYYILGQQYIAAVLNGLSGASVPAEVADAIAGATAFFGTNSPTQAAKLSPEARAYWIGVAGLLDSYNNGYEGVPHCE
jgi:hypothetical protein